MGEKKNSKEKSAELDSSRLFSYTIIHICPLGLWEHSPSLFHLSLYLPKLRFELYPPLLLP